MIESIEELLAKEPFEPFRIATSGGDKYLVRNPHNVVVLKDQIFYAYAKKEKWVFIRNNQISSVESAVASK